MTVKFMLLVSRQGKIRLTKWFMSDWSPKEKTKTIKDVSQTVLGRRTIVKGAIAVVVGSVIYRFIYAVVLYTKVVPVECLKLVTAIIVGLAIAAPTLRSWVACQKKKAMAGKGE